MNINELDYEDILIKLKFKNVKNSFQIIQALREIIGPASYDSLQMLAARLSEFDKDIKDAMSLSITDDLVSVQPMAKSNGLLFYLNYVINK